MAYLSLAEYRTLAEFRHRLDLFHDSDAGNKQRYTPRASLVIDPAGAGRLKCKDRPYAGDVAKSCRGRLRAGVPFCLVGVVVRLAVAGAQMAASP